LSYCHIVPNDQVRWGAGGYSKSVGKAGNDGSANDVQFLVRGRIRGTKGFQPQGLTLRSGLPFGRRVVWGGGQGSLAAATAAGGRPPTPATAYY